MVHNLQTGEPIVPMGTLLRVASGKCFLAGIKLLLHPLQAIELPEGKGGKERDEQALFVGTFRFLVFLRIGRCTLHCNVSESNRTLALGCTQATEHCCLVSKVQERSHVLVVVFAVF